MNCINKILEFYYEKGRVKDLNSDSVKIWYSNMLRTLTSQNLTNEKDYLRVKNCLILLINLFSGIDDIDHYNLKGKGYLELSKLERNKMNEAIRTAILNDSRI
ncbi:MAG: hypothetical protein ACFFBP_14890 [Promethearchaeota archaeon]